MVNNCQTGAYIKVTFYDRASDFLSHREYTQQWCCVVHKIHVLISNLAPIYLLAVSMTPSIDAPKKRFKKIPEQ